MNRLVSFDTGPPSVCSRHRVSEGPGATAEDLGNLWSTLPFHMCSSSPLGAEQICVAEVPSEEVRRV